MKWYFALNEPALPTHGQLAMAAVASARQNTSLEPHLIYDGAPSRFTDWMSTQGVTVIHHRLSIADEVLAAPPRPGFRASTALGAYLRTDLPLLEQDERWLLYTDVDVVFLRHPALESIRPKLAAAAREVSTKSGRLSLQKHRFNTGVMVLNASAFRARRADFVAFVVQQQFAFPAYDQGALNAFFGAEVDNLSPRLNHRPFMMPSAEAAILHFHGVKPSQAALLLEDRRDGVPGPTRKLFGTNPAACALSLETFLQYLPPESHDVVADALESSAVCAPSARPLLDPTLGRLAGLHARRPPIRHAPSRPARVFIHVGLGYQARRVQRLFRYGRLVLARHGLYYPLTGLSGPTAVAHDGLAAAAADADAPPTETASPNAELRVMAERLRAEIDQAGIDRVLLSSRAFARLSGRQILRLAAALGDVRITPVLQLRNQRDWLEELYAEHLCASGPAGARPPREPEDFVACCPLRHDYPAMVREWNRVADDRQSLVLSLDALHDDDDPLGRLLEVLGIEDVRLPRKLAGRGAFPITPAAAYAALALRRAGRRDHEVEKWLAAMDQIGARRSAHGAGRLLPQHLQDALLERYHEDKLLLVTDRMLARCLRAPLPDVPAATARSIADLPDALLCLAETIQRPGLRATAAPFTPPTITLRRTGDLAAFDRRRPGQVLGHLDEPRAQDGTLPPPEPGPVPFKGWVCAPSEVEPATAQAVLRFDPLGGSPRDGRAVVFTRNRSRADVHERLPGIAQQIADACGFDIRADLSSLSPGRYVLRLGLLRAAGVAYQNKSRTIEIGSRQSHTG